jgi:hypothetical protein
MNRILQEQTILEKLKEAKANVERLTMEYNKAKSEFEKCKAASEYMRKFGQPKQKILSDNQEGK